MQYYHDLVTERSFALLRYLRKKYHFILIGGWAVFLYTRSLKSKDIDIILDYKELSLLKENFLVRKNERLKKYEIQTEGIDVDIYLPYFKSDNVNSKRNKVLPSDSEAGSYFSELSLPCQEIKKFTLVKEGFVVPIPEALLILKQAAFLERQESPKGRKDKIDIFSLLLLENFNFSKYKSILEQYHQENFLEHLKKLIEETYEMKELYLSRYKMARLKKKILRELI